MHRNPKCVLKCSLFPYFYACQFKITWQEVEYFFLLVTFTEMFHMQKRESKRQKSHRCMLWLCSEVMSQNLPLSLCLWRLHDHHQETEGETKQEEQSIYSLSVRRQFKAFFQRLFKHLRTSRIWKGQKV